jgi:hypothetical protein
MLAWLEGQERVIYPECPRLNDSNRNVYVNEHAYVVVPENYDENCSFLLYYPGGMDYELNVDFLYTYIQNPAPNTFAVFMRRNGIKKAGVLATDGTCQADIYGTVLEEMGIEPVYPSEEMQKVVMSLIYDHVKAGKMDFSDLDIEGLIAEMQQKGAEILILGCTELPVAFSILGPAAGLPTIDPTDVIAEVAVRFAGAPVKGE